MALPQTDSPPSFEFLPFYKCWKTSAALGIVSGMAVSALAKIDVETCNKRKQSWFARLARSFRVGGVRGGVYAVTLSGVLNYLNEKRGVVDVHNFAASNAVAGAAFALMLPAAAFPPGLRHRSVLSVMASSVYAGVLAYPGGWAYLKAEESLIVYFDDLLKQIKEGEHEQCDEAHMKDQEAV